MRYVTGEVMNVAQLNQTLPGTAITEEILDHMDLHALAAGTDMSIQTYAFDRMVCIISGEVEIFTKDHKGIKNSWIVKQGQVFLCERDIAIGVNALTEAVLIRLTVINNEDINPVLKLQIPVYFRDMAPYVEGRALTVDLMRKEGTRFSFMSMDRNVEIPAQTAASLIFITGIEGSGYIRYDGMEYPLKAHESFGIEAGREYAVYTQDDHFKLVSLAVNI